MDAPPDHDRAGATVRRLFPVGNDQGWDHRHPPLLPAGRSGDPDPSFRNRAPDRPHPQDVLVDGARSPRVLLVEDDIKFGWVLERAFTLAGYEASVAGSGDAALAHMAGQQPDAAVVDVMIPHPDGIETCRQFRRDGFSGPIVVISARSEEADRRRAEQAGADAFLAKPLELTRLLRTVAGLVEARVPTAVSVSPPSLPGSASSAD